MRGRGAAIRSTSGTFQPHVRRYPHTERSQLRRRGQIIDRRRGHRQSADHGRSFEGVTHLMVLVIVITPAAATATSTVLMITSLIMNGRDRGAAMAVIMLRMALCSQTRGRCHQLGRTQTITPKPTTDAHQLCKPNRRKDDESHHHSGSSGHAKSRVYILETNATRFRMPQPSGFADASPAGAAPATSPRAMASA